MRLSSGFVYHLSNNLQRYGLLNFYFQSQIYSGKLTFIILELKIVEIIKMMEIENANLKKIQLVDTNCSIDMEESDRQQTVCEKNRGKKRIGKYSFYYRNFIGSGFSSRVYRGTKEGCKGQSFAIKVIKVKDMNVANIYLLNNEIAIMQRLQHDHIVKFVDVLHTDNHCYLITQYCDGGTLEKYIKSNESVEWGSIVYQIADGCKYLASNNIVHRDLKPANIFLKQGKWKIGDFGFSKCIPHSNSLIIEGYKVGSPLFMPLQTLERNMYSAKSDSFALGIIIYYLIFKEFPWHGSSLSKLVENYKRTEIDFSKFSLLPIEIVAIIRGLCRMTVKQRLQLSSCNFDIFLNQKSIKQINASLMIFKPKVTQQVVLCQFINYLIKNSMIFLDDGHILYSLMSSHLYHLTEVFSWNDSKCLRQMKNEYILPEGSIKITEQNYRKILEALKNLINLLKFRVDSIILQVCLQKLLEYYFISQKILQAEMRELQIFLKSIVLHKNFSNLIPNYRRIESLMLLLENQ